MLYQLSVLVNKSLIFIQNKAGDCNEHSILTVALLRSAGIPAQMEAGLVYLHGRFYWHAWNVLYLGGRGYAYTRIACRRPAEPD
ncbi:MAG: hypothetical protein STSR0002_05750 [Smithella sp.]